MRLDTTSLTDWDPKMDSQRDIALTDEDKGLCSKDLDSRLMSDIDPDLLVFLRTKVNSSTKWDLLHFFHENPHTIDTVGNIARYIGRSAGAMQTELAELAAQGVLVMQSMGEMTVYSLSDNSEIRGLIQYFIKACYDRQFRVKAIYHMIRAMH